MSSKIQINCQEFPTLEHAHLMMEAKKEAKRQFALQKGRKQSNAADEVRRLNEAKTAWNMSSDNSYVGATKALLSKPQTPVKAPVSAPVKAPAPAPFKSTWKKVGGSKKKPKGKERKWVPPEQYIASLKKQIKDLNQMKVKAKHDGKTKDEDSFQRQINSLWGKMKRAEKRLRQSDARCWNAQYGGLRKEHKLTDFIVKSKRK